LGLLVKRLDRDVQRVPGGCCAHPSHDGNRVWAGMARFPVPALNRLKARFFEQGGWIRRTRKGKGWQGRCRDSD
jgi:hypothetical protein